MRHLQDELTTALEALDGGARFREDSWERPGGGGGCTRVLEGGALFERAGVNFSHVFGAVPEALAANLPGEGDRFSATGVSLVLHPASPMVPTVHANFRRLERGAASWIGGGADLTPYVLFEEDARHFHRTLKAACDRHDGGWYPRFKQECDRYFWLEHRGEARGVGGIFFDHLQGEAERLERFLVDLGSAFLPAYRPIVERRRGLCFGERERRFQMVRRGRYVEFNLLYDRGTAFGLSTSGRTESILMSLPPLVRWEYDFEPVEGSPEASLLAVLRRPRDWAEES
ncbi:MAG: oxygen-dependent coproporphyrinogen oxidase [Deltaproteobacteria bacterium]|nr:oxygen-dependent coproporphyrinogen oxidase [Deltaproteobacteria bacterium]